MTDFWPRVRSGVRPGASRALRVPLLVAALGLTAAAASGLPQTDAPETVPARFEVRLPRAVLAGVPFEVTARAAGADGGAILRYAGTPVVEGAAFAAAAPGEDGTVLFREVVVERSGFVTLTVRDGAVEGSAATTAVPGVVSLAPPLVAILLAILLRQVVLALVAGIWVGSTVLVGWNPLVGFFDIGGRYVIGALTDSDRAHIIVFSFLFGGLAGILARGGGARGFAELILRFANNRRRGQLGAMATALVVFFDDYANVIIRGNLMRPITDGLRVSREKLAFLTDTGAASVASTVIVSTWIGYEVGLIDQALDMIAHPEDGYSVFLRTIPYRFYPIFSFALALAVGFFGRDFGPMRAAERRAYHRNEPLRPGSDPVTEALDEDAGVRGARGLWINGILPIAAVLLTAGVAIGLTGSAALAEAGTTDYGIAEVVTNSDSYVALLWASIAGCAVGILLAAGRRILSLGAAIEAWLAGLKSMMLAIVVLVLAWSLGDLTAELHAAQYLVQLLENTLAPALLPTLTFIVAGIMAFATGTSWATMAVLMPLVIPLAHALSENAGLAPAAADPILMGVVGAVLAGAVFGDHCSPISDTTILSSMASACDHLDHVRTQLPYALSAAGIAIVLGILPTSFGVSPWIALPLGIAAAAVLVRVVGSRVDAS